MNYRKTALICIFFVSAMLGWCIELSSTFGDEEKKIDAKKLFEYHCVTCHGKTGKATKRGKALKAPNFADAEWQVSITDEEILETITNGKNKMPRWSERLSKEEIAALAKYIRKLAP